MKYGKRRWRVLALAFHGRRLSVTGVFFWICALPSHDGLTIHFGTSSYYLESNSNAAFPRRTLILGSKGVPRDNRVGESQPAVVS